MIIYQGFPGGSAGKEPSCDAGNLGSIPGPGKIPWRRKRLPTPVRFCLQLNRNGLWEAGELPDRSSFSQTDLCGNRDPLHIKRPHSQCWEFREKWTFLKYQDGFEKEPEGDQPWRSVGPTPGKQSTWMEEKEICLEHEATRPRVKRAGSTHHVAAVCRPPRCVYILKTKSLCISSVQFSCSVVSNPLQPHGLQHTRPPCPSPTPGVHPNPCPLSR